MSPSPRPLFAARPGVYLRRRLILGAVVVGAAGGIAVAVVSHANAGARAQAERRVAEGFAVAWSRSDYAAMYRLLSAGSRRRMSERALAAAYRRAGLTATARSVDAGPAGASRDGRVVVPVRVRTQVFGTVAGSVTLPLVGHGAGARVAWTPALTFPGLRPGERLRSRVVPPRRAPILARDGSRLSADAAGSSPLGSAGLTIAGGVGTPTHAQRAAGERQAGTSGHEQLYDQRLAGRAGGPRHEGSRRIAQAAPHRGRALRTTIDPKLQQATVAALGSRYGGVAVLSPRTGDVLALAGLALSSHQPPGSTFKIVTLTGALQAGTATPSTAFPIQTGTTLSGVLLRNAGGEACGGTLAHAFAVSCNSVFAPLGVKLGARRLVAAAQALGFNHPSRLPGTASSTIPAASKIGDDLALGASAIGQGRLLATPLEMASVAATIAAGGVRANPRQLSDLPVQRTRATPRHVARTVSRLMIGVVSDGTGTAAQISGVEVAGKTGTAELRTGPNGLPSSDPADTDAWFAAFAPARHAKLAVAVLLVGAGFGGQTAAPIARQVLAAGLGR